MNRRDSIKQIGILLGGVMASPALASELNNQKDKTIMVISGWQYHNIGVIAHTPGLLHLLNQFMPEARIILWPNHKVRQIDEMLYKHFPGLKIVNGKLNAFAVLSFECHSPIMSCFNGTPAFYLRQPEDTIKGQMWYDIGLEDWVFEIEKTTGKEISKRLMEVYDHYGEASQKLEKAMDYVRAQQYNNMTQVRKTFFSE